MPEPKGRRADTSGTQVPRRMLSYETIGAGTVGNILEWYDFGLYGYFAPVIGGLFFPSHGNIAPLLGAYGGFAIGFAMRPLGGAVLGHLGDRVGRQAVLVTSVVLMGCATTAVGLLPTYRDVGIWAPILLLAVRCFQGFSVGGEFTGSVSYLVETAPRRRRGFAGSFANVGSTLGYLLAAGLAALTETVAGHHLLYGWTWRLPFMLGGVLAVFAYFVRNRLSETGYDPGQAPQRDDTPPLKQAFDRSRRAMILAMIFTWGYGVADYLTLVFLPTFASKFGHVGNGATLRVNTVAEAIAIVFILFASWMTDRHVRRRTLLIGSFSLVFVVALVLFELAHVGGVGAFWIAQIGFGVLLGTILGTAPAMLAELFRSEYRLSGYSLSFNFGFGFGGGTAPLVATGLIGLTGFKLAAAGYLMVGAAMSIVALYFMRDRSREPLQ